MRPAVPDAVRCPVVEPNRGCNHVLPEALLAHTTAANVLVSVLCTMAGHHGRRAWQLVASDSGDASRPCLLPPLVPVRDHRHLPVHAVHGQGLPTLRAAREAGVPEPMAGNQLPAAHRRTVQPCTGEHGPYL
ncbi:hypothetical protein D3C80_1411430 [compost metagenome]